MTLIYKNIIKRCKDRGISIHALEKAVGLGNATIRGWETSSPNISSIERVASFFGCTVDDLIKEE